MPPDHEVGTAAPAAPPRSAPSRRARLVERALIWSLRGLERAGLLRRWLFRWAERRQTAPRAAPPLRHPIAVEADKRAIRLSVLRVAERALAERRLSDAALRGLLKLLVHDVFVRRGDPDAKARFRALRGCGPPDFLVLSPGRACNLRCAGCYANSGTNREKLPWDVLERLVREAHDLWGTRFFVLSGGEPLAYRDQGRGVFDLAAAHPDCFFILYTNGTLIDDAAARRLGELGNLSPGLSVEGLRERTDARRGAGVFDKVLAAMERLRREGVLFGLSLTATRENSEEILSDAMVALFFERLGAAYAWVFHYMPIGRAFTLDLMMTPEQRVRLWRRTWDLVRERRLFIADFWSSATISNGCIAGGRPGGYFYVDWNGNVNPCVFMPYSPVNIHDVYRGGGTLDDVWGEPFFAGIRAWQRGYGYREPGERYTRGGNWLAPCLMRDHHADFLRLCHAFAPRPADDDARAALDDPAYHAGLERFDCELATLTEPIWEERYARSGPPRDGRSPAFIRRSSKG